MAQSKAICEKFAKTCLAAVFALGAAATALATDYYLVKSDDNGTTTAFTADQAQSTGQWVKLGEFDLKPGATLTIIPAKSKGHIAADGFALIIQKEEQQ